MAEVEGEYNNSHDKKSSNSHAEKFDKKAFLAALGCIALAEPTPLGEIALTLTAAYFTLKEAIKNGDIGKGPLVQSLKVVVLFSLIYATNAYNNEMKKYESKKNDPFAIPEPPNPDDYGSTQIQPEDPNNLPGGNNNNDMPPSAKGWMRIMLILCKILEALESLSGK